MIRLTTPAGSVPLVVSTGSFWPRTTAESLECLAELSLCDVELTLQPPEFYMSFDGDFRIPLFHQLMSSIHDGKLAVWSVHAPHMNAEHGHSMNARTAYLARSLELCAELGGQVLVTHPFHLFISYEHTLNYLSGSIPDVWQALLPGVRTILHEAEVLGISVTLENVKIWADDASGFFNLPANVARFLDDVSSPALGLTLDLIHARLMGSLQSFLDRLSPFIVSLHIADLLAPVRRVPPGEGELPWSNLLPTLCALPALQLVTLELTRAEPAEVARGIAFLQSGWPHPTSSIIASRPLA